MIGTKKISRKIFGGILGTATFLYLLFAALMDNFTDRIPYGIISHIALDVRVEKQENIDTAGEMVDGSVLLQSFKLDTDKLVSSIKISGATYMRINQGNLRIRLFDAEKQNPVRMWVKDVSEMVDNEYLVLSMGERGRYLPGKEYVIEITAQGGWPGNAVTFYTSRKDIYAEGDLYINGKRQAGDLCFQILEAGDKKSFWSVKIWIRIYRSAALAVLLYVLYEKYGHRERDSGNEGNSKEFKVS